MKIAFIGTGGIARRHAEGLVARDDVQFVGAFDVASDRAEAFAAQYGGAAFADLEEMLDTVQPDAVWICLPPFAHGPAEMAVLERRIPFLTEKPMAVDMDTAKRILERVEQTGTLAAVGYMNRYRRSVQRAKELLADDPAVLLHGGWIGGTPLVPWWRVKAQSGGQIVEQTTHTFDLARYLVGELRTVYARGTRGFVKGLPGYDVEDASSVVVEFENGAIGNLMSCCANRSGGAGVHLTVVAVNHVSVFTGWEHDCVIHKSRIEEEHIRGVEGRSIFAIEDDAFIRAVQTGQYDLVRAPYSDAIKSLAFCLAANMSLETGKAVQVSSLL